MRLFLDSIGVCRKHRVQTITQDLSVKCRAPSEEWYPCVRILSVWAIGMKRELQYVSTWWVTYSSPSKSTNDTEAFWVFTAMVPVRLITFVW